MSSSSNIDEDLINEVQALQVGETPTTPERGPQRRSPMDPGLTPPPLKYKQSPSATTQKSPSSQTEGTARDPVTPSRHRRAGITYGGEQPFINIATGRSGDSDPPPESRSPFDIATATESPSPSSKRKQPWYVSAGPGPATVEGRKLVDWNYPAPDSQVNRVTLEDLHGAPLLSGPRQSGDPNEGAGGQPEQGRRSTKYSELRGKVKKGVEKALKR